jgi:hypothetical protein
VTKTIAPWFADVQLGSVSGVLTTSASEYTPLTGCGGDDGLSPSLPHPAPPSAISINAVHDVASNEDGITLMVALPFDGACHQTKAIGVYGHFCDIDAIR